MAVVDVFADAGMVAYEQGVLPDALLELSLRLEIAGVGSLLNVLMQLDFTARSSPVHKPDEPPQNLDYDWGYKQGFRDGLRHEGIDVDKFTAPSADDDKRDPKPRPTPKPPPEPPKAIHDLSDPETADWIDRTRGEGKYQKPKGK